MFGHLLESHQVDVDVWDGDTTQTHFLSESFQPIGDVVNRLN